jgi:sugar phosphate isomerase/epimerase
MNMRTVTFHPGQYSMAVPDMQERSIATAKRSIRMLDRIAEEYGVNMALENMPSMPFMLGHTAQEMAELIDGTEMPICFDVGHANTVGQIDEIIDLLGDRIINVHIHDNDSTADKHMTVGDGNIDFGNVFKKLRRYTGNYIIEARSLESAVESLDRLNALLR